MKMDEKRVVDICRICLRSDFQKAISIFDVYKSGFLHDHINSIAHISIIKGDGLPDKMCSKCLADLKTCVKFKMKCRSSNDILIHNLKAPNELEVLDAELVIKKEEPDLEPMMEIDYLEPDELFADILETELLTVSKGESIEINVPLSSNESPQCHDCGEYFKSKCKLRVHWKKTHRQNSYVCPVCRRLFKSSKAYNKHMKSTPGPCSDIAGGLGVSVIGEGKNRVFHCSQCDYKSQRMIHIRTHLVTHSGKKLFQCDICHKSYTQRGSMMSHKETVHLEGLVVTECHICGKTFNGRRRLYKHLKTHTEESYHCDICKKVIKGKKSLQTHMLRHSGVKSYTCEHCAASFYTMAELCNHRKKHIAKVKAFKCDMCQYHSSTKYLLKKHMKQHISGEKPYSCKVCGHFFMTTQKLSSHEKIHYENKKYSCPLCAKMFYCRRSVSKHVIAKHNSRMLQNREGVLTVKQEISIFPYAAY